MEEKMRTLHELCEVISRELEDVNQKIRSAGGSMSAGDLELVDKLTHALKSIKTTMAMMGMLKEQGGQIYEVNRQEFHLLVTANVNAVFQAVEHGFNREEAMHYADTLDAFFTKGWQVLFGY